MKSYKDFLLERAFSERGQKAREQMRAQNGLNAARNAADRQQQAAKVGVTPPSKQKALPPGITPPPKTPTQAAQAAAPKGGALEKRAADKGAALVRSKGYKEPRAERPDEKMNVGKSRYSPRVRVPEKPEPKPEPKPRPRPKPSPPSEPKPGVFSRMMKGNKEIKGDNKSVAKSSHSGQIS